MPPPLEAHKADFIHELRALQLGRVGPWLIYGDFNLNYKAFDKNNNWLN
jgi:hypothetical protein